MTTTNQTPINLHELSQQYGVDKSNFFVSAVNDKVMILYGENPNEGIAGFGATPEEAIKDFASNWRNKYNSLMKWLKNYPANKVILH